MKIDYCITKHNTKYVDDKKSKTLYHKIHFCVIMHPLLRKQGSCVLKCCPQRMVYFFTFKVVDAINLNQKACIILVPCDN